jgi:hypothetical protein
MYLSQIIWCTQRDTSFGFLHMLFTLKEVSLMRALCEEIYRRFAAFNCARVSEGLRRGACAALHLYVLERQLSPLP